MPELELPWPPSANAYWVKYQRRIVVSPRARAYKLEVAWICRLYKLKPDTRPLSLTLSLYPPDRRHRDGHNFGKVLLDALEGHLYKNDAQVIDFRAILIDKIVPNGQAVIEYIFKDDCEQSKA